MRVVLWVFVNVCVHFVIHPFPVLLPCVGVEEVPSPAVADPGLAAAASLHGLWVTSSCSCVRGLLESLMVESGGAAAVSSPPVNGESGGLISDEGRKIDLWNSAGS